MRRAYMVQENGQVTLPIEFRRKYAVQKRDWIIFQETADGLVIRPEQILAARTLDETQLSTSKPLDDQDGKN